MRISEVKFSENSENELFEIRKVGKWLTSTEAANVLGVSPNALRIMVCRGLVKYSKLGRQLRFREADLNSLLQKGA